MHESSGVDFDTLDGTGCDCDEVDDCNEGDDDCTGWQLFNDWLALDMAADFGHDLYGVYTLIPPFEEPVLIGLDDCSCPQLNDDVDGFVAVDIGKQSRKKRRINKL